jgi:2-polyprenyl-6-hydroxyphenyl methylase/3-demethylubiquinone-9 3-methyltransferase
METTQKWKLAQNTEIRWWQNYLKKKDKDDYLHWKKNYWHSILDPVRKDISLDDGDAVLDAGCGPSGIFIILDKFKVDAEDPLLDRYDQKLYHFKKSNYPRVNFYADTLENFNPQKKYQCVFCMNAINHVSDLNAAFDKLVDLTNENGNLIISIDSHNHSFFKYLFRLIPVDVLHPHQYNLKDYETMLTLRNCTLIRSKLIKKEFFFNHILLIAKKN